jgi:hypothetical protein
MQNGNREPTRQPIPLRVAIRKSGDALLTLINEILAGRLEIERAPFDITQWVE